MEFVLLWCLVFALAGLLGGLGCSAFLPFTGLPGVSSGLQGNSRKKATCRAPGRAHARISLQPREPRTRHSCNFDTLTELPSAKLARTALQHCTCCKCRAQSSATTTVSWFEPSTKAGELFTTPQPFNNGMFKSPAHQRNLEEESSILSSWCSSMVVEGSVPESNWCIHG